MIPAVLLGISPVVFLYLWFAPAPYGRHDGGGWGPKIPGRLAWLGMEWPTLIVFTVIASGTSGTGWLAVTLWLVHYVRRTLIYPALQSSVRPMPVIVVLAGMGFQLLNCVANGEAVLTPRAVQDPWLWVGVSVFLLGQGINLHGDEVLRTLRPPGDTGYHLPTRGLYRWVTNVSYLGEMVSWLGWAVLTGSMAGLAFFVFTVANLAPRARSNVQWYQARFGRQPGRWALLPGVW